MIDDHDCAEEGCCYYSCYCPCVDDPEEDCVGCSSCGATTYICDC